MIVSEKNVSDALHYLALGGEAEAYASYLAAKQARHKIEARIYLAAEGPVKERESQVIVSDEYQEALSDENAAEVLYLRGKRRVEGGKGIIDIWRTETANARAAESIR